MISDPISRTKLHVVLKDTVIHLAGKHQSPLISRLVNVYPPILPSIE